ncbi:hypothetical protein P7K49_000143 [Saguinus oedipus]|uniref:Ras-related protein Rab-20 n=1 Tax=Saguinus oedipus TaxID=9490 RepID=A0ABQ9WAT8_SAGOE|nr:hypothetical protein P7K49_000143 [Saguinus oedipus]
MGPGPSASLGPRGQAPGTAARAVQKERRKLGFLRKRERGWRTGWGRGRRRGGAAEGRAPSVGAGLSPQLPAGRTHTRFLACAPGPFTGIRVPASPGSAPPAAPGAHEPASLGESARGAAGPDSKIVLLGDMNVGKTSLLQRYMERRFPDTVSTVGGAFYLKQWRSYNISIWDTADTPRWGSRGTGARGFQRGTGRAQGPGLGRRTPFPGLPTRPPLLVGLSSACSDTR